MIFDRRTGSDMKKDNFMFLMSKTFTVFRPILVHGRT
jgi:hypothetical protein